MSKGIVPLLDEEHGFFIAQTQGHAEAQTAMALNSKAKHAERYEFRDKDAFTREVLFAGRVKSRVFSMKASVTQQAVAARHTGHHYDRSRRCHGSQMMHF